MLKVRPELQLYCWTLDTYHSRGYRDTCIRLLPVVETPPRHIRHNTPGLDVLRRAVDSVCARWFGRVGAARPRACTRWADCVATAHGLTRFRVIQSHASYALQELAQKNQTGRDSINAKPGPLRFSDWKNGLSWPQNRGCKTLRQQRPEAPHSLFPSPEYDQPQLQAVPASRVTADVHIFHRCSCAK